MAAGWPEPLRRQVSTLVLQFLAGSGRAWIGIADLGQLGTAGPVLGTMRLGGSLRTLGAEPLTRAFVWVQGTEPELWVDPTDTGYRDLYDAFAKTWLGLPGRPDGRAFNIDHLFPKAAGALDGLSHVRVMAIEAAPNQSAGRTLEKAMKQRASDVPGGKLVRHATWQTIGKVAGFTGWEELPKGREGDNSAVVKRLFAHLGGRGITPPAGVLEHDLTAHTLSVIR
ncbi:hypothetical protein [Falsiroseomonas sp.]|uniref:hypothetical protein n=1 Tax=Falsiroseomonas sp. TaxID=2870721 RepID=UPI003564576F